MPAFFVMAPFVLYLCITNLSYYKMKKIVFRFAAVVSLLICLPAIVHSQELSPEKDSTLFFSIASDDPQGYSSLIRMYPSSKYQARAQAALEKLNISTITPDKAMGR